MHIPLDSVHGFRTKPSTDSGRSRPLIPDDAVHLIRQFQKKCSEVARSQLYPSTDPVVAMENPPKTMVAGHGCFVTDSQGKTYLDAVAGLWWVALGFDNQRLISAAMDQMQQLPYYHSFMNRTTGVT